MQRVLYLQVLDYDRFSRNDPIGEVSIPLNKVDLTQMQTFWKDLKPCSDGSVRPHCSPLTEAMWSGLAEGPHPSSATGCQQGSEWNTGGQPPESWLPPMAGALEFRTWGQSPELCSEPRALFRELEALSKHRLSREEEMAW